MINRSDPSSNAKPRSRRRVIVLAVVALLVAVFVVIGVVASNNRKSMEPIRLTQCFRALDQQWGMYRKNGSQGFYKDEERGCYGQRWAIPKAYYSRKHISYHPITETLTLRMGILDLTPGALLPKERAIALFTEVEARALWAGRFADQIRHTKTTYGSFGWVKTSDMFRNMSVYDQKTITPNQSREIFLFPPNDSDAQLFVQCGANPDQRIHTLPPHNACKISANVEDRVYIKYYVRYSQLENLTDINTKLVNLVRSFMINQ